MGNDSTGAHELYDALTHREVSNTFHQLIKIDRARAKQIEAKYSVVINGLKKIVEQSHEVEFECLVPSTPFDPQNPLDAKLLLKAWTFSGIQPVNTVEVDAAQSLVSNEVHAGHEGTQQNENENEEEEEEDEEEEEEANEAEDEDDSFDPLLTGEVELCKPLGAVIMKATSFGILRHECERMRRSAGIVQADPDPVAGRDEEIGAHSIGSDSEEQGTSEDQVEESEEVVSSIAQEDEEDSVGSSTQKGRKEKGRRIRAKNRAVQASTREEAHTRQDLVSFAVRTTKDLLAGSLGALGPIRDGQAEMPEYVLAASVDISTHNRLVKRGWAKKSKLGEVFGAKMNPLYVPVLAEMFIEEGDDVQHHAWYRKAIATDPRFAARLDHPTEQHVKKLKTRFLRYRKRVENYNKKVDLVDRITPNFMEFLVNDVSQIPGGKGSQLPAVQENFIQENASLGGGATVLKMALADANEELRQSLVSEDACQKFKTRVGNVRRHKGFTSGTKRQGESGLAGTKRQRTAMGQSVSRSNQPPELEDFIAENPYLKPAQMLQEALKNDQLRRHLLFPEDEVKEKDIQKKFKQRVGNIRSKSKGKGSEQI